jgi:hypothetical protein
MKKSFIAVAMTVLLFSGALFTKSYVYSNKNSLINLVSENLEALTDTELYHCGQGTCGVKFWDAQNGDYDIYCGISYDQAQWYFGQWGGNWCCDNCESSTYCAGHM